MVRESLLNLRVMPSPTPRLVTSVSAMRSGGLEATECGVSVNLTVVQIILLTKSGVVKAELIIGCYGAYGASDVSAGVAEVHLEVPLAAQDSVGETTHKEVPPDDALESLDAGWTRSKEGIRERDVEVDVLEILEGSHQAFSSLTLSRIRLSVQLDLVVLPQMRQHFGAGDLSNGSSIDGKCLLDDSAVSLNPTVSVHLDVQGVLHVVEWAEESWKLCVCPSLDF
jgi:hypothetical protein